MCARLLGYPQVTERLQRELAQGCISHAYLVLGPPQVGKKVLALELAQALNCQGPNPPCGVCPHCQKTAAGLHPDVQVLGLLVDQKGERLRKAISIDQVLALQHDAGLHPYWGRYRIFIIDEAQRLSVEAANCLLKTLEEPPPACIIVLLATEERALPSTVVSRCRRVHLRPLARARVEALLSEQGARPEEARLQSRLSGGRLGWALSTRGDSRPMGLRARGLEALGKTLEEGLPQRFRLAEEMANLYYRDRETLDRTLQVWLEWWRDLLLVKGGCSQAITNVDQEGPLWSWSERLSTGEILAFIKAVVATLESLERNVHPRLALEALLLEAPGGIEVPGRISRRSKANA